MTDDTLRAALERLRGEVTVNVSEDGGSIGWLADPLGPYLRWADVDAALAASATDASGGIHPDSDDFDGLYASATDEPKEHDYLWHSGYAAAMAKVSALAAPALDVEPVAEALSRVDTGSAEGRAFLEGYRFAQRARPAASATDETSEQRNRRLWNELYPNSGSARRALAASATDALLEALKRIAATAHRYDAGDECRAIARAALDAYEYDRAVVDSGRDCTREKWCDMPDGHSGECRSADDR